MGETKRQRQAILARRAILLSTAMATIGCPSTRETSSTDPVDASTVRTRKKRRKKKPAIAVAAPWSEVMKNAPPMEIPDGLSERERAQHSSVVTGFKEKYDAIGAVWKQTPGCDPSVSSCNDWRSLAVDAQTMYHRLDGFSVGSCGGAVGQTASVVERSRAHAAYVSTLVVRLEAHLEKLAVAHGPKGTNAWAQMLKKAKEPPPRPCLSPCRMPVLNDIIVSVAFEKDAKALRIGDASVLSKLKSALATVLGNRTGATVVVRGHADPSEANAKQLADSRAKAVAKWLVEQGVLASTVTARSLGATLQIERSPGPRAGAANRRVDFLVVPR